MSASPGVAKNRDAASVPELRELAFKKGGAGVGEGALRIQRLLASGLLPNARARGRFGEIDQLDCELWRAACYAPSSALSELARLGCRFESDASGPGSEGALEWSARRGRWEALSELLALPQSALPAESSGNIWKAACWALAQAWESSTLSRHGVEGAGVKSGAVSASSARFLALALIQRAHPRKMASAEPERFPPKKIAALKALAQRHAPPASALVFFFETLCSPGMRLALELCDPTPSEAQGWLDAAALSARSSWSCYICQAEPLAPMREELEARLRFVFTELVKKGAAIGERELSLACAVGGGAALGPLLDSAPELASRLGQPPALWALCSFYSQTDGELHKFWSIMDQLFAGASSAQERRAFYQSQIEAIKRLIEAGADPSERGPNGLLAEEALMARWPEPAMPANALFALAGVMGAASDRGWREILRASLAVAREARELDKACCGAISARSHRAARSL